MNSETPDAAPGSLRLEKTGSAEWWWSVLDRFGPVIALFLVFGLFSLISPEPFATLRRVEILLRQSTIVMIAALGMTLVIIMGGIDLSVGSVVAFTIVIIGWMLNLTTGPEDAPVLLLVQYPALWPWACLAAGVLAGVVVGLLNGALITLLGVAPFIVTLGTMMIVRGAAKLWSGNKSINMPELPEGVSEPWFNRLMQPLSADERWMLLPRGAWIMILLAIAVGVLLKYTKLGRYIFAVGSNEETARLCGVPVNQVKLIVYALAGLFMGIAGLMMFSRLTVGDPTAGQALELSVIAAVVIGGASLNGGEGSVLGTIAGALLISVIVAGCTNMGLENYAQEIVTGSMIVVAVGIDRLRHRRAE